jgi:DNA invertase Pin-like site-specific DNA recombinase
MILKMFHVKHFCPVAQKIPSPPHTFGDFNRVWTCDNLVSLGKIGNAAWADTTTAHGRLMLMILGGLAEFERELIRSRTSEGRARAKARGVKLGKKPKLTEHQKREAIRRRDYGDETLAEIGRSYNVSGWTISRLSQPCR